MFAKRWRYVITCLVYKRLSFLYPWLFVQDIQCFPPMECSSSIPLMKFNCLRHHEILLHCKKNHEMPKLGAQHVILLSLATAFCLKWHSANLPTYLNPDVLLQAIIIQHISFFLAHRLVYRALSLHGSFCLHGC
jgi:hypothetical protein